MAKTRRLVCRCEHCVHGKKELNSANRTCRPCLSHEKNNFRKRKEPWPIVYPVIPGILFKPLTREQELEIIRAG